jgi:hypothetical protein
MNKWKIAFWSCLIMLCLVTAFSAYLIINKAVTLTYQKEGYANTENDLMYLIAIFNKTDLTKRQIENILKEHKFYDSLACKTDTISLERVLLIFENGKLKKITKQW